jgi:hypothetical protein
MPAARQVQTIIETCPEPQATELLKLDAIASIEIQTDSMNM